MIFLLGYTYSRVLHFWGKETTNMDIQGFMVSSKWGSSDHSEQTPARLQDEDKLFFSEKGKAVVSCQFDQACSKVIKRFRSRNVGYQSLCSDGGWCSSGCVYIFDRHSHGTKHEAWHCWMCPGGLQSLTIRECTSSVSQLFSRQFGLITHNGLAQW